LHVGTEREAFSIWGKRKGGKRGENSFASPVKKFLCQKKRSSFSEEKKGHDPIRTFSGKVYPGGRAPLSVGREKSNRNHGRTAPAGN